MIKRILVALSGTRYTPIAVQHAVALAKAHDAEVTGVTVTDLQRLASVGPVPVGGMAAASTLAEHRILVTEQRVRETIKDFEAACQAAGVAHSVEQETCDPLEELMSLARFHDLVVFGPRGLFEYGVVHNPDDRLTNVIRHGVRPILAVSEAYREVRRVLVAFNGSMESAKAMKQFAQHRLWPDLQLRIVCFERKPAHGAELVEQAARYCKAHGFQAETEVVDGNAREGLLAYAEGWEADLVVLGSTNRLRILKQVLGDTVLTAIRHSTVPLFLSA
ncbi:MAG: universal stress protein [Planctomycetota bacterium]|jgi:nucleotide-binding universal stress UspA family protein